MGHFTLSMQDAAVDAAGVPVSVVRSYDSRDLEGGEFGPGWRLDLRSADLEKRDCAGDVAVTLPDGRRATFGFEPRAWVAPQQFLAEYRALESVQDALVPLGDPNIIPNEEGGWSDWDLNDYCPENFVLTTERRHGL